MISAFADRLGARSLRDWARLSIPVLVAVLMLVVLPALFAFPELAVAWAIFGALLTVAAAFAGRYPIAASTLVLLLVLAQTVSTPFSVILSVYGDVFLVGVLLVFLLAIGCATEHPRRVAAIVGLATLVAVVVTWLRGVGDLAVTTAVLGSWSQGGAISQATLVSMAATAIVMVILTVALGLLLRGAIRAQITRRELAVARQRIREREARSAMLDQRRRIAGDVHDVLAHSLTVIVAQGEGALVSDEPARSEALERLVEVARSSLRDVRGLIERLDDVVTDLPSPGLDDLPRLFQTFSDAGVRVTVDEHGAARNLGEAAQLAVYRIAQESLTNVLKHGGRGSVALVTLDWRGSAPDLLLTVASISASFTETDGVASAAGGAAAAPGAGVGMSSMRTRAEMTGGWLTMGPTEGGWIVTAQIPGSVSAGELATA